MTAEDIAKVLGGRRAGPSGMAHCPAHNDREPRLSIHQAVMVLVRCHAGCEQARVITALGSLAANGLHDVEIRLNNQIRRFGRAA
jgi:putative DNA primase/helicase